MNKIQKNLVRIKNTLMLAAIMAAGTLLTQCKKDKEDDVIPTPPIEKVGTIVSTGQNSVAADLNKAAQMLGDSTIPNVVIDMSALRQLELGDQELSLAIDALTKASDINATKSVRIIVPKLLIKGTASLPAKFYEFTRGSTKYTQGTGGGSMKYAPDTRASSDSVAAPSTIVINGDGSLHFEGELKSNELLSVLSAISSRVKNSDGAATPKVTADRIKITERMGTASDGPKYGLPMWAIFDLVKTNEISSDRNFQNNALDGSAQVLFGHIGTPSEKVQFKDAQNMMFYNMGDRELRKSSTPGNPRNKAVVEFDNPINMGVEMFTDTVRMGGVWKNGVWTPDSDNWTKVISESQMAYGRPGIVYPEGYLAMTGEERNKETRLIIHTNGGAAGSDTTINGVKRNWVNLEDIIAYNGTVMTGAGNIKWKPGKPLVVRVPSELTPADLKEPINGKLHSWDNFFFYDCRIDVSPLPGNIRPIFTVVDTTITLNKPRLNALRAAMRRQK